MSAANYRIREAQLRNALLALDTARTWAIRARAKPSLRAIDRARKSVKGGIRHAALKTHVAGTKGAP